MTTETNSAYISPHQVLHKALELSSATYVDINPSFDPETSPAHLLTDSYAVVYGSLANLIVTPKGGRSRIFQGDYFSGVLSLMQEPLDSSTATLLSMTLTTAILRWEPRVQGVVVQVTPDFDLPGYTVSVSGQLVGLSNHDFSATYSLPQ